MRQHEIKFEYESDTMLVDCDVDMLLLAISNVLDNAIRYTPDKGFISIELKQEADKIILTVEDSGIGMSDKVKAQIFKRFYREDTARSTRGFGLGMTITRRIVELHLGEIEIESAEAQGTTVSITLPLGQLQDYHSD